MPLPRPKIWPHDQKYNAMTKTIQASAKNDRTVTKNVWSFLIVNLRPKKWPKIELATKEMTKNSNVAKNDRTVSQNATRIYIFFWPWQRHTTVLYSPSPFCSSIFFALCSKFLLTPNRRLFLYDSFFLRLCCNFAKRIFFNRSMPFILMQLQKKLCFYIWIIQIKKRWIDIFMS